MVDINQSLIGNMVSFSLYSSAITKEYSNVEILAIGNYRIATGYIAPAKLHAIIYPSVPTGQIENDYRAYEYVVIRQANDQVTAIGIPWIIPSSVSVSTTIELEVIIRDKSIDDIPRLRQILSQNGFLNATVQVKNT